MTLARKNTKVRSQKLRATGGASSARGLRAIDVATPQAELVRQTVSVVPFLIKTAVVVGIVWFLVNKYKNRFVAKKLRSDLPASNISDGQAEAKASAIAGAIGWISNDFDTVADALADLNYNGFVKLYNAFGHHTGTLFGCQLDLIEYIQNQFTDYEVSQLSALLGGAFF